MRLWRLLVLHEPHHRVGIARRRQDRAHAEQLLGVVITLPLRFWRVYCRRIHGLIRQQSHRAGLRRFNLAHDAGSENLKLMRRRVDWHLAADGWDARYLAIEVVDDRPRLLRILMT